VEEGNDLDRLLGRMVRRKASDLHLVAGLPPVVRVDGRLARLDAEALDGGSNERLFRPHPLQAQRYLPPDCP
jgi:twitching motility protein PilT